MSDGTTNSGIAAKLKINGKTVSNYVTNILNKLQVADREEAIHPVKESRLGDEEATEAKPKKKALLIMIEFGPFCIFLHIYRFVSKSPNPFYLHLAGII